MTAVKWPHVFHALLFCPIKAAVDGRSVRTGGGCDTNIAGRFSFASFSFPETLHLKSRGGLTSNTRINEK